MSTYEGSWTYGVGRTLLKIEATEGGWIQDLRYRTWAAGAVQYKEYSGYVWVRNLIATPASSFAAKAYLISNGYYDQQ